MAQAPQVAQHEKTVLQPQKKSSDRIRSTSNKTKMASSILWLLSIFSIFTIAACIDDNCAACNAVAAELEIQLSKEKPRNHLDMRNRLDSKGQRQGKVIDYRMSELRAVELLDGLCEKMQDYTLEKIDSSRRVWIKVDNWEILTIDKQEAKAHSKDISSYCGRLLEETEDEVNPQSYL
ncbi:hypothetical protein COLO4_37754 [Corchorus olitorius]|uniref:DUF3456 domain-containing protein n=1 Tax=Corchorus olitorius TaxID=93759 RepID=A0A1R3FZK0_9ROSI|nr:hypothetical protein COLO4_37754 [Corchorus olitorius]